MYVAGLSCDRGRGPPLGPEKVRSAATGDSGQEAPAECICLLEEEDQSILQHLNESRRNVTHLVQLRISLDSLTETKVAIQPLYFILNLVLV